MATEYIAAKYNVDLKTVDYTAADGTHLLRTGGPIAWRFNNPGNLRPAKTGKTIYGALAVGKTKSNGEFLIFKSYAEGRKQKRALLRRKYNERTIYTMLAGVPNAAGELKGGYAPKDDKNDPEKYSQEIAAHIGKPTTYKVSDLTDAQLDSMMDAMEQAEGFHSEKQTRKEKIVPTTSITISDGAQPKPNMPVKVAVGGVTKVVKTNARGQLPPIPHTEPGKKVELFFPTLEGGWLKGFDFAFGSQSKSVALSNNALWYRAPSDLKKAEHPVAGAKRKKKSYPIQPGDTLGKLAKNFDTTVPDIMRDNPHIKDAAKIYPGQVIILYGDGKATPPASKKTATSTAAASKKPAASTPPTTPKRPPSTGTATQPARSKEGAGAPLALIEPNAKRAPWMEKAIAEAKKWKGQTEEIITKTHNFHALNGAGFLTSLTGKDNAWCGSFVNYCLANCATPYAKWKNSFRARAVALDTTNFVQIDKPVYGAIVLVGTHHVSFVYGKSGTGYVCLGGNQDQQINFTTFDKKLRFYVPIAYHEFAKKDIALGNTLLPYTHEALNKAFGIVPNKDGKNALT